MAGVHHVYNLYNMCIRMCIYVITFMVIGNPVGDNRVPNHFEKFNDVQYYRYMNYVLQYNYQYHDNFLYQYIVIYMIPLVVHLFKHLLLKLFRDHSSFPIIIFSEHVNKLMIKLLFYFIY